MSNVRISGTPSPCYQGDRPAERKSEPIWHQEDASFYLTSLQPSRDAVEVEGVVTPVANQFCANEKMEKIKQDSHIPQATVHSSLVAEAWLAWHSMHRSMMWFLVSQAVITFYPYSHSSGNTGTQQGTQTI